jgi:hypothetical protein
VPQFRRKPSVVEATQWFRNGDHPYDESKPVDTAGSSSTLTEGKVVKFFRRLHIPGDRICQECGSVMHKHGLIMGLNEEEEIVHPGDYILTHAQGYFYRRSARDFEGMFEPYNPEAPKEINIKPMLDDLDKRIKELEEFFKGPENWNPANAQVVNIGKIGGNLAKPTIPDPGQKQ